MQGKCIKNEKKISVRFYGIFLIIYLSRAAVRGIFVFPRASAHYTPAPPERKLRGKHSLKREKIAKNLLTNAGGGGGIMDVLHKLWQKVGA